MNSNGTGFQHVSNSLKPGLGADIVLGRILG
jgi:hypothetical protein